MGDIFLDFRPSLSPGNIENLKRMVNDLEAGQSLYITLERRDAHQTARIGEILKENGFDYQTKGGHRDEFHINARKK